LFCRPFGLEPLHPDESELFEAYRIPAGQLLRTCGEVYCWPVKVGAVFGVWTRIGPKGCVW
jgi:hypothetical protein